VAIDRSAFADSRDVEPICGTQLAWAEELLAAAGMPSPRSDALVLLAHVVQSPSTLLLADPGRTLSPAETSCYAGWVHRRAHGQALASITRHQLFMGLDLQVNRGVPIVQPATQRFAEIALECLRFWPVDERQLLVAEVGTGCGAIAVALGVLEPRIAHIYAVDGSAEALAVAQANGDRYLLNVLISWLHGDVLEPIPEPVDLIVASRRAWYHSPEQVGPRLSRAEPSREPSQVPFDHDGSLLCLEELVMQAPAKLRPGGMLIAAVDTAQTLAVARLLAETLLPQAHIGIVPAQVDGDHVALAQLPP